MSASRLHLRLIVAFMRLQVIGVGDGMEGSPMKRTSHPELTKD